ncbi:ATP-dependent DNA helicase MER3, partial [Coemansia biformis]
IATSVVDSLCQLGLLESTTDEIAISALGECVARHGVDPVAMAKIVANLPPNPCYQHVLETVCGCSEFDDLRITVGQKGVLNELNKNACLRFKVASRIDSVQHKVFILIQYGLQRQTLPSSKYSSGLASDMGRALGLAYGPAMCIRDAYASQGNTSGVLASATL